METPAILTAAIICITSLAYLVLYTIYWPGVAVFYAGTFLLTIFFAVWMVIMTKFGKATKSASLRTTDFAMIAVFGGIYTVVTWTMMFLPGPIVYIPWSVAFTSYLPSGIILAALLKIVPKPGAAFTYLITAMIMGQIIHLDLLWAPWYILRAVGLEAYYLTCKRGTISSLVLMGFTYGILSSATGAIFFIGAWLYWQPLLVTIPTAILCGITAAIGASMGHGVGSRAGRIAL